MVILLGKKQYFLKAFLCVSPSLCLNALKNKTRLGVSLVNKKTELY